MTPPDTPEIDEKRRRFESTALPFLRDLSNVARRLAHRDEDARDLVQETWLRAYRTFDNFRPGTNCKAWLLTILYSIFINQYRKARREPEPASLEELDERFHRSLAVEAEAGAAAGWSDSEVEAAFDQLPESLRVAAGARAADRLSARDEGRMSERGHFSDEIQQLLDGRLSGERRAALEEHLAACESCRREREAISAVRAAARRALGPREVPSEVSEAIRRGLDRETPGLTPVRSRARLALAAGLLAAALAVILILLPRKPKMPAAVETDFEAYRTGRLALALETADTRTMETFFAANGISFRTRVFALGMMQYRLAGGRVPRLAGRPSALFVYVGEREKALICEMYEGRREERAPPVERREHGGFTFFIYRDRGKTAVFWQEGLVTCVLVSDIDSEEVIALAFAKAMKA